MKKILLSLAMIAMVSATAVGATQAYYSDTELVPNNTFATGTLDLRLLPGWLSTTEPMSAVNMAPGESFSKFVVMQDAGTIGISRVGLTATRTAGSTYLYDKLRFRSYGVTWSPWPNFVRTGSAQVDMLLKDVNDYQIWTTLAPLGMSTGVEDIEIYFPSDADITYQGLSTTWTFSFLGIQ